MTRAKSKAPVKQAEGTAPTAPKNRSKAKPIAEATAMDPVASSDELAEPLEPDELGLPAAIQKGRTPKHINRTQALAMGTAAAGIGHLLGWL